MASITVDISARVVGYQESLKAMEAAFAKVDPGSAIGKKLGTAIDNAKKQVADLGRNMFPKASSDTQIDAIADRVNRVGAALQNLSTMFQSINIGDLNFKALSPDIASAVKEMEQLQTVVNSTMNGGIQQAIANSSELSGIFKSLGADIKSITADSGGEMLAKGLTTATQEAEKATKAYDKIAERAQAAQEKLSKIQANVYSSKNFNMEEVMSKFFNVSDPKRLINEDAIQNIRTRISEALSSFKGQGSARSGEAESIIRDFFGLDNLNTMNTVDEFRSKFEQLCNQLKDLGFNNQGIVRILGTTKGENIFNQIFNLDSAAEETRNKLNQFMEGLFSSLNFNNQQKKTIRDLIDKDQFQQAVDTAKDIIKNGYKQVSEAEERAKQTASAAFTKLDAAKGVKETAESKRDALSTASDNYKQIEADLRSKVQAQENRIAVLENTIQQLTQGELGKILAGTGAAGANAGKQAFPIGEAQAYGKELTKINSAQQFVGKLQGVTQRWFSVYAAVRMVTNAVKQVIANTKELDATITEIAIVTNKSQDDLWGQMPQYIEMAKKYGASISGAYKVSQLYYQQGLGQEDVMALSEQTLKMARISGLDYAQATDYMTNAVRSFKMEMTDAASVVDTYSAVAAASATSVTELATAMSKTASSAQSVGSSLQNTTAMMAVMIEATRESPENIGSAMKSIISRYGELKENKTGIDEEGEEYSLNKVDTALQSVGISIHDANGEFRDFDDVIFELADHWNEIDKNTQRYIATVMAGNRQQSRFLALVSSTERLKELSTIAADSEDASQMQFLKTLDSIEYKSQQMKTSLQSLYADKGIQNFIKDTLDYATNVIDSFKRISDAFNSPLAAITKFGVQFANIARIVTTTFGLIKTGIAAQIDAIRNNGIAKARAAATEEVTIEQTKNNQILTSRLQLARETQYNNLITAGKTPEEANALLVGMGLGPVAGIGQTTPTAQTGSKGLFSKLNGKLKGGRGFALAGLGLSMLGSYFSASAMGMGEDTQEERTQKALKTLLGSTATGAGMGSLFGLPGMIIGSIGGLVSGLVQYGKIAREDAEEKTARLKKELETAQNENISKKNEYKTLKNIIDEYEKLKKTHLDSTEAAEEYLEACNKIAEEYPDLISGYDAEGNAIVNLTEAYQRLKDVKSEVSDTEKAEADKSIEEAKNAVKQAEDEYQKASEEESARRLAGQLSEGAESEQYYDEISKQAYASMMIPNWGIEFLSSNFGDIGDEIYQLVDDLAHGRFGKALSLAGENITALKATFDKMDEYSLDYLKPIILEAERNITEAKTGQITGNTTLDQAAAKVQRTESSATAKFTIGAKSVVDSEIQELLLEDKINGLDKYGYLSEFGNASTLISRRIAAQAKKFKDNIENEDKSYYLGEDEEFTKDFNAIRDQIQAFWLSDLSKSSKQLLDNLIANQGNYTKEETQSMLSALGISGDEKNPYNLIYDSIMSYYTKTITSAADIFNLINSTYGKRDKNGKIGSIIRSKDKAELDAALENVPEQYRNMVRAEEEKNTYLSKLGQNELSSINKFYNNILDAVNANTVSEDTATQIAEAYVDSWKFLTGDNELFKNNIQLRQKAQTLLAESDFTNTEGIEDFVSSMKDLGIDIEALTGIDFHINFPPNFGASIQTFADKMASSLTDFEKDMNSVTKGMDFKTASDMATKLGTNLTKFRQEGNKFYLDDYNLLEQYYFEDRQKRIAELSKEQKREEASIEGLVFNKPFEGTDILLENLLAVQKYSDQWYSDLTELFSNDKFLEYLKSDEVNLRPDVLQQQIVNFMKTDGPKGTQEFLNYVKDNNTELYNSYIEASGKALTATIAESQLSIGNIAGFIETTGAKKTSKDFLTQENLDKAQKWEMTWDEVAQIEADEYNEKLIERIASGDITNLEPELEQYGELIYNTYKDTKSSLINALFDAMEGGEQRILVTDKNKQLLEGLKTSGLITGDIKTNEWVDIATDALMKDESSFRAYIDGQEFTQKQRAEWIKKWHDIHYPDPKEIASKMMTSTDYISYNAGQDLYTALKEGTETEEQFYDRLGIVMTDKGGKIQDRVKYIEELNKKIAEVQDPTEKRELEAELASNERLYKTQSIIATEKAVSNLLKDTDTISEESRTALEKAIGIEEAAKYFKDNKDGTHKLDVISLRKDIENETIEISNIQRQSLLENFAQLGDEAISAVESAVKLTTSGTNKQEDMQKIANAFNNKYTQAQLFTYDQIIGAYTFNSEYLSEYQRIQAQKYSDAMDVSFDTALSNVQMQTQRNLASQVGIEDFINASNRKEGSIARQKITTQLENLQAIIGITPYDILVEQAENEFLETHEGIREEDQETIRKRAQQLWQQEVNAKKEYAELTDMSTEEIINDLEAGGDRAIELANLIAKASGQELSSEQLEKYYYAEVNRLKGYSDQIIDLTEGQYIAEGDFKDILDSVGMIDSNGLVTNITNAVEAYQEIYERMNKSGEQTASQLNSVYAKLLTAEEQSDIDAISVMGDAMGMTYDALGSMLGKYGIELKQWLSDNTSMYEKIGNGKVRITDFTSFADQMGWEAGSEEWTSAFKTYNDGLIEANKKVKDSIEGELKGFAELQPGDWLNLTYTAEALKKFAKSEGKDNTKAIASAKQALQKAREEQAGSKIEEISDELYQLEQEDLFTQLNNKLSKFGATLDDGILKLFDNANMLGIADTLSEYAKMTQAELGDSFYEIADTIAAILSGYVESVRNGIKGSLKSSDMGRLISQAADMGISLSDMDFSRTTEGFKLSNKQAINMYQKLKQIDHMQSRLVFDDLKSSLEETNDDFKTTTSLLSYIGQLQRELASNLEVGVDPSSLEDLQNELSLALEINLVNLNTDEADWNFMNQDVIPASFKNAIEYFTGVADATTLLGDAATNGYVEVDQFAALVNHIQEVAMGTGQTLDFLGQSFGPNGTTDFNTVLMGLADIYTIDPKTKKAVVTTEALMSKLGLDLTQGAEGLTETVRLAIAEYVKKNAEQLQHVADFYGGLGELDDAIAEADYAWSNYFKEEGFDVGQLKRRARDNETASKLWNALTKSTENIYVNGKSLAKTLKQTNGVLKTTSREYKAIKAISDLIEADLDWTDPDSYGLISSRFADAGFEGTIDLGEVQITVENGSVIMETGTGEDKEVIYNNKRYATREDAIKAIRKEQNDATVKQLQDAQKSFSEGGAPIVLDNTGRPTSIVIDGASYNINYNKDGIATVNGVPLSEVLHTKYQEYVDREKEIASDKGYLSETAWQVDQGLRVLPTIEQQGGVLTADQQQAFLDAGINNVQQLETFLNDPVRRKNFEAAIGVSLPFKYDENDKVLPESLAKYGDQVLDMINNSGLTQSISQGVAKAFSEGGASESLSQAIHDGLTKSLKSEGKIEVDAPEIVIKPKSITIDSNNAVIEFKNTMEPENTEVTSTAEDNTTTTTTAATTATATTGVSGQGEETYSADLLLTPVLTQTPEGLIADFGDGLQIPIEYEAEETEEPEIPDAEALINYITGEVEQLDDQTKQGVINWLNQVEAFNATLTKEGTIWWTHKEKNSAPSTSGGCFIAGTQIIMADLTMKNIEDIQIGEQVIAYNDENKQFEVRTVNKSYAHYNTPRVIDVTLSNSIILGITPGHPILTTKGWKSRDIANSRWEHNTEADWLNIGDEVIGYFGNAQVMAIEEHQIPDNYITYNIEVETCHTFLADGIVVHNAKSAAAIGNVGLIGNARAAGTLMGELGPELVVQNGRYFVAGQNGAEFVDLASDAIVFNHLQTERLFKNGMSPDRGHAITNERVATAFAYGNWNGGEAKENRKNGFKNGQATVQTRANEFTTINVQLQAGSNAWRADQNLRQGKAEDDTQNTAAGAAEEIKNFIKEFERWFNWLQKIAQLEKEITLEESKRSRYESAMTAMGDEFYSSQKRSLDLLEKQVATQQSLISAQYDYYQSLREQLNAHSEFKTVYTFDENFQPIYNDDYEKIQAIRQVGFDKVTGAPNADVKSVYAQLVAWGYGDSLVYDTSGNKIDTSKDGWQATAVQAFYDRMDKQLQEAQKLHDDIMDGQNKIEELEAQRNEIMRAIEQNQITVENKVMKALEESRQREIDELQKERDAIEKSSQKLIDGLNDQLQKEQDMYNQQKDADELATLQRQLAILQRSGGSAAQIADLQNQIADKQKTMYFDTQQKQIDAVEEASKNQLERLDHQIDLMQETLDYQKEYGLLWGEVSDILSGTKESILAFISGNTSEYWNKYTTELNSILRQDEFEIQQYKAIQADQNGTFTSTTGSMNYLQGATTAVTGTGNGGTGTGGNQGQAQKYAQQTYTKNSSINPDDIDQYYLWYQTSTGQIGVVTGYGTGPNTSAKDQAYAKLEMLEDNMPEGMYVSEVSTSQSDLSLVAANSEANGNKLNDLWYDGSGDNTYTDTEGNKQKRTLRMWQEPTAVGWNRYEQATIEAGGIANIKRNFNIRDEYTRRGLDGQSYNFGETRTKARNVVGVEEWDKLTPAQQRDIAWQVMNAQAEGAVDDKTFASTVKSMAQANRSGISGIVIENPKGILVPQHTTVSQETDDATWYNLGGKENFGEVTLRMLKKGQQDTVQMYNYFKSSFAAQYGGKRETDVPAVDAKEAKWVDNKDTSTNSNATSQQSEEMINYSKELVTNAKENTGIYRAEGKSIKEALDANAKSANDVATDQVNGINNVNNTIFGLGQMVAKAIDDKAAQDQQQQMRIANALDLQNQREEERLKKEEEEQAALQQAMIDQGAAPEVEQLLREYGEYDNKDQQQASEAAAKAAADAAAQAAYERDKEKYIKEQIEHIDPTHATADYIYQQLLGNQGAVFKTNATITDQLIDTKKQKIKAKAKGTLLGELGPEAYVSNGTLHIAGLHGAEFVDLPDDAIVFNHLQTARLLQTGMTSRGTPTTSEEAAAGETRQTYLDTFWQSVNSNSSAIQRANTTNYSIPGLNENSIINNSNNGQTVTIERAEVNLQIEKLANDYDSRRAADQVMEEMLRIASKTSMNNSRGRG